MISQANESCACIAPERKLDACPCLTVGVPSGFAMQLAVHQQQSLFVFQCPKTVLSRPILHRDQSYIDL